MITKKLKFLFVSTKEGNKKRIPIVIDDDDDNGQKKSQEVSSSSKESVPKSTSTHIDVTLTKVINCKLK